MPGETRVAVDTFVKDRIARDLLLAADVDERAGRLAAEQAVDHIPGPYGSRPIVRR